MRGYSGTATKWVDFVVTDSTRRESGHSLRVETIGFGVKGWWWKKWGGVSSLVHRLEVGLRCRREEFALELSARLIVFIISINYYTSAWPPLEVVDASPYG